MCTDSATSDGVSRRKLLGAAGLTAAVGAGALAGPLPSAQAASARHTDEPLSLTLLGTSGGPPPLAARYGISSALTVNGRTYVIDCGRGSVTQYLRAGLSMPSLAGIFLTHLHSDHTVDYFSYPLLSAGVAGAQGFQEPIDVYGPSSAGVIQGTPTPGQHWVRPDTPGPGTAEMTALANQVFAQSSDFFMAEHFGSNPTSLLRVHDVAPPAEVKSSPTNTAPTMRPFTVMENDDLRVTAVLVPHGAVYPSYAYRFETEHGSVVFSGDTAPTPNIPTLAHRADLLVHEAAAFDVLATTGYPPAVLDHIRAVHTDIGQLGAIAAEAEVAGVVATHLSPADPALLSTSGWRDRMRTGARSAGYRGELVVGTDLLRVRVPRRKR